MVQVHYPEPRFRIKKQGDKDYIFDPQRKRWLLLTPEEWVRQNFIQYLVQVKAVPAALVAVEKELQLGELKKRFDILVYDRAHRPWMLVECKSMDVALQEETLHQVLRYSIRFPAPFLVITNGTECLAWTRAEQGLMLISEIPVFA